MNKIYVLMETGEITKTVILATTFHKPAGEENVYVQFRCLPLKIFNYTRGRVSGSINTDPINANIQFNRYKLLLFIIFIICQVLLFGFLFIMFALLIVDLFVCIDWIRVYWYWNLSSSMLANCMWDVCKPDILILPAPGGLSKVMVRVPVGCQYFFASIDCFAWSKSPSSSQFMPYFVYFWLVCIIFIISAFIDPETCPQVC